MAWNEMERCKQDDEILFSSTVLEADELLIISNICSLY